MTPNPHNVMAMIADRMIGEPLLLQESKARTILNAFGARLSEGGIASTEVIGTEIDLPAEHTGSGQALSDIDASGFAGSRYRDGKFSLARAAGGVAIVGVQGSLVNRGAWIGASSGLMSYEGIAAQLDAADADEDVQNIVLDVNSPGGEATGMIALAEKVRDVNSRKPITAVVNDVAASAAYGIISGATEIVITPTSIVGSIGVVLIHLDHSGELAKKGVKATILQRGSAKTHGNPFGPLSESATASLDARIDTIYSRFLETVEQGRGERLTADDARATEADVFLGEKAIELGLADRIGTFDAVLDELQTKAREGGSSKRKKPMANEQNEPTAGAAASDTVTTAAHNAAVAAARTEGEAAGAKIGATAERERIAAIMGSETAKTRQATALSFALTTDMTPDQAETTLKTVPEASTGAKAQTLAERAEGAAEIGSDTTAETEQPAEAKAGWGAVIKEHNARVK